MEVIFFPVMIVLIILEIIIKKTAYLGFVLAGYVVYSMSLIRCIFDIIDRIHSNDTGGILDIYPTLVWAYIVMLVILTLAGILAVRMHKER